MLSTEFDAFSGEHLEQIQRVYLSSLFSGCEPRILATLLERDGRKRSRVIKEAIKARFLDSTPKNVFGEVAHTINPIAIESVTSVSVDCFELWSSLLNKYSNRSVYAKPWIRLASQSIEVQNWFLKEAGVDWYVVAEAPYESFCDLGEYSEMVILDGPQSQAYDRYWSGPFPSLDDAISRRKEIPRSSIAASTAELRCKVKAYFHERKIDRMFTRNLLWGLVEMKIVPSDLVFDAEGKPTIDTQLDEGHSLRFETNPDLPDRRGDVTWEENLLKSTERLKRRIALAEQQLSVLRAIHSGIQSFGGWHNFMNSLDAEIRLKIDESTNS